MMLAELVQKGGLLNQSSGLVMADQGCVAEVATVAVATPLSRVVDEGWRDVVGGLPLLREDQKFVDEKMKQVISVPERHRIAAQYRDQWRRAEALQPVSYRKENSGRFAANSCLRKEIDHADTIH